MAAVTASKKTYKTRHGNALVYYGTGGSNADATLTTDVIADHSYRVSYASATYSGSPTQAGVTFGIDSGLGSGYDATITTGSANVKYSAYTPSGNVILGVGDAFTITAPAGGAMTAALVVVLEPI